MSRFFPLVERHWTARLDGAIPLDSALRLIAAQLRA
jgi:hypothetical protein